MGNNRYHTSLNGAGVALLKGKAKTTRDISSFKLRPNDPLNVLSQMGGQGERSYADF
jgi:hypothetical protein